MRRPCALALAASAGLLSSCARPDERPNILFIVVDTLRSDFLHAYGYPDQTSPAIDALAARGWLFENHLTHATQTVPATLSLLLSQTPAEHGLSPLDPKVLFFERPSYPPEFEFLAEVLRDAGYATAGFTANPYLMRANGFDQGFDVLESPDGPGEVLTARALEWLGGWAVRRETPFFLYLHYMDVHQPYAPKKRHLERFVKGKGVLLERNRALAFVVPADVEYTRSVYAACVAHVDDQVGAVLGELDALGVRENTIVVLTSDHGEEFGEHGGVGHGRTLYGEVVRVPLVISFPRALEPGRRIAHLSQHIDVAPTLLRLAGIEPPASFRGGSLLEVPSRAYLEIGRWRGVVEDGWKLVANEEAGIEQLFSLSDPLDREPLDRPEDAARLRASIAQYEGSRTRDPRHQPSGQPWSSEELERLRALGYIQ